MSVHNYEKRLKVALDNLEQVGLSDFNIKMPIFKKRFAEWIAGKEIKKFTANK